MPSANLVTVYLSKLDGQPAAGLANDHQVVHHPCLISSSWCNAIRPGAAYFSIRSIASRISSRGAHDRLSQSYRFGQNAIPDPLAKTALGYNIDRRVEQGFQVEQPTAQIE